MLILFFLKLAIPIIFPQYLSDFIQLVSIPSFHLLRPKALKTSLPPFFLRYPTCNPSHLITSNFKKTLRCLLVFTTSTASILMQASIAIPSPG